MEASSGSTSRHRLAGLLALAVLTTAACSANDESEPAASTNALDDITLSTTTDLPSDLSVFGPGQTWVLPTGQSVTGFGARRVGEHLVMSVNVPDSSEENLVVGATPVATQTWVLDTETGVAHRYPLINEGWQETTTIGAGNWMLRKEVLQLPAGDCSGVSSDDCFSWRLYAQEFDSATPLLLAQSEEPGSQGLSPSLTTDGKHIAWEQGEGGKYTIHWWTPGTADAETVAERNQSGLLDFADEGRLFVLETAPGATMTSGAYEHALTQIPLPGQENTSDVTTFHGITAYSVIGDKVVYYPKSGDTHGNWVTIPLGSEVTSENPGSAVVPAIDGPYSAHWITPSDLLSFSATGITLYDLNDPADTINSDSTDLTAPRIGDGYLSVGYSSGDLSLVYTREVG